MLRIKLYQGSKSMENYLNKKMSQGYTLEAINPFDLFRPFRLDAYQFKKSAIRNRVYRVDSRKISNEEMPEYKQLFLDDGWKLFKNNFANDHFNEDHIFYSDDPSKQNIFSDVDSERKRNRDNASMSLFQGCVLAMVFIIFSIIFPSVNSGSSHTIIGFILHNLYIVIAMLIIVVSFIRYFKYK